MQRRKSVNTKGKMSFKDFIFPVNPSFVRVLHSRAAAVCRIPYHKNRVHDMGVQTRVISGSGEFFGRNCESDFCRLKAIFEQGGAGMLYIPSQKPVYALFDTLELDSTELDGVIKYSFRFIECPEQEHRTKDYMLGNGENCMWDLAFLCGTPIEELMALNPDISRPDTAITAGKKVRIC